MESSPPDRPVPPALVLMDNGSLEPEATLSLRRIAGALSRRIGRAVEPVSLLHSHKIPAERLEGGPAECIEPFLRRRLGEGCASFLILPLFIGPSAALTDYLPARLARLRERHPELQTRIAPCLYRPGDDRLASMLEDNLNPLLDVVDTSIPPPVMLVDHGSPRPEVTAVREALASQMRARLGPKARCVVAASMERRPGPEFAFNEPLLARALDAVFAAHGAGPVLIAPLFLQPGRHAGPGGDIARLCAEARARNPGLSTSLAPLLGTHPGLIEMLMEHSPLLSERVNT
jgi:sirohydrochlorin ferrochelatase